MAHIRSMKYDVAVVGGGPGGLHCARILSEHGVRTVLLERNKIIGRKVCAGGITWGGLIKTIPEHLIERSFSQQTVITRFQKTLVTSKEPMVATVDRVALGQYMAETAGNAGAEIISKALVERIDKNQITYRKNGSHTTIHFDYLVGADGSNSKVRAFLDLNTVSPMGVGVQYRVNGTYDEMIWNFDSKRFRTGYSWIFPHRTCASVGAYEGATPSAVNLKERLHQWLSTLNIDVSDLKIEADSINHRFVGWSFGRCFLIGDAAGLASPLTGEGINPAIVSGETAARTIIDASYRPVELNKIIVKHQKHQKMAGFAEGSAFRSLVLSELCSFLLRHRMLAFNTLEMA